VNRDIFTQCKGCGEHIHCTAANTVMYAFTMQPWFTYIMLTCPVCEDVSAQFFGPEKWMIRIPEFIVAEVGLISEDYPEDSLVKQYEQVYKLRMLEPRDLTPYQEKQILFWRWLIDHKDWRQEIGQEESGED